MKDGVGDIAHLYEYLVDLQVKNGWSLVGCKRLCCTKEFTIHEQSGGSFNTRKHRLFAVANLPMPSVANAFSESVKGQFDFCFRKSKMKREGISNWK